MTFNYITHEHPLLTLLKISAKAESVLFTTYTLFLVETFFASRHSLRGVLSKNVSDTLQKNNVTI